jgi:hypothetical protein
MMILAAAMLATVSVYGQTVDQMRVTVPFEFSVGDQTLPAGKYIVTRRTDKGLLELQTADSTRFVTALVRTVDLPNKQWMAKLVFQQYGDQKYLSEMWLNGSLTELLKSKRELMLAKSTPQPRIASVGIRSKSR